MQKNIFDLRNEITKEIEKQIKDILPEKDPEIEEIKEINVNITEGDSLNGVHSFLANAELTINKSNGDSLSNTYEIRGTVKINIEPEIEVSEDILHDKQKTY